jgi:septal ring factor EnvC (AmiA/AmiB activator)
VGIRNSNITLGNHRKEKKTMRKPFALILIGCAMVAGSFVGCSSKPSEEELKQLNDLKAEVTSLEKGIAAQQSEKAALLKTIADKDAQLAQCAKDKEAVQQRLKATK